MNMKEHILSALREQLERWEVLLAGMTGPLGTAEAQVTAPLRQWEWSTKDVVAHVYAWQQRSIARMEAALAGREPEYPQWLPGVVPDSGEDSNAQINAWIYAMHRDLPWSEVHQMWREGYLRFIDLGQALSERDLLDASRYPWMGSYTLADSLIASYDHHQEHYEKLLAAYKKV